MEKRYRAVHAYIKKHVRDLFAAELETEAFQRYRVGANISYGLMVIKILIVLQLCFIVIGTVVKQRNLLPRPDYPYFIWLYIAMVLINLGTYYWLRTFDLQGADARKLKRFDRLFGIYSVVLIAWGVGLTLMGQSIYSNLTAFFINLIVVTTIFKHPKQTLNRFFLSLPILLFLLPFCQKNPGYMGSHYVNATTFTAIFWLISHQMHSSFQEHFSIQHELVKSVETLEVMALEDQLTGLPNRRGLDSFLKQMDRLRHLENTYLCALLIDIDCFKQYNDTLGHMAGDEALKKVAQALRDQQTASGQTDQ